MLGRVGKIRRVPEGRHSFVTASSTGGKISISANKQRRCHRIIRNRIHQSDLQCPRRVNFLRSQKHLQGKPLTDQARQTLRASPSRDQTQGCAAMSEQRVRTGEAAIACQRQVKAASHAVAVDGSNRRSRKTRDRIHQPLAHLRKAKRLRTGERGDLVEVSTCGKEVRIAGKHQARGRGFCQFLQCCRQPLHSRAGQAVGAIGRDQTQNNGVAMGFQLVEWFVHSKARVANAGY